MNTIRQERHYHKNNAEMKSRYSEKLLKEIRDLEVLEAMGDAVSIQDSDFTIIFQNKASKVMFGEHVGKYCYKAYALQDKVCKDCSLAPVFADGKTHTEVRSKPSYSGILYFEITASPLRNVKGEIIAGIEVTREITERKNTEATNQKNQNKYKELIDIIENEHFLYSHGRDGVFTISVLP